MADGTRSHRSPAEMVTTAICVLLIALVCGAIIYEGYAAGDDDPALVEVTVDAAQAEQRGDLWYVPFEVVNTGDETIQEIWVVVEGADGSGQTVVESETTVQLLGESERAAAMAVFETDPRELEMTGRVRSFQIAEDV